MYNYEELAGLVPELSQHIKAHDRLDYSNEDAVRLLNRALLLKEFNLNVKLPRGHLCPTVPNRTAYILAIEFILSKIMMFSSDQPILGIDIGTGASCIYPLIACARNEKWSFIATEIDDSSLHHAQSNLENNPEVSSRITLFKNDSPKSIFPEALVHLLLHSDTPKFVVCNPPFYKDQRDIDERRDFKRHRPTLENTEMTSSESITELGEVGFIRNMITDSRSIHEASNLQLFSCILGFKDSLNQLLTVLKSLQQDINSLSFAYQTLRIKHTTRWLLFWSFSHRLPSDLKGQLNPSAKTKGSQIIPIDEFNYDEYLALFHKNNEKTRNDDLYCSEIESKPVEEGGSVISFSSNNFIKLKLTKNIWSRRARRSGPFPLVRPICLSIAILEDEVVFNLLDDVVDDSKENWDNFISFVNHLRMK